MISVLCCNGSLSLCLSECRGSTPRRIATLCVISTAANAPRLHRGYQGFESLITYHFDYQLLITFPVRGLNSRVYTCTMSYSIRLSDYISNREHDHRAARREWEAMKPKADYVIRAGTDEILYGDDVMLNEDEMIEIEDTFAAKKEPYGNVPYADPGYQADKKKRYPIDTEEHIRAAWSYINQAKNAGEYSPAQVSKIKARIVSAWKRVIDKAGPPSA